MTASFFVLALVFAAVLAWLVVLMIILENRRRRVRQSVLSKFAQQAQIDLVDVEESDVSLFPLALGRLITSRRELLWIERKLNNLGQPLQRGVEETLTKKAQFTLLGVTLSGLAVFSGALSWGLGIVASLAAYSFVDIRLNSQEQDRNKEISRRLASVVDVLVLAVEAGMNFQHALALLVESDTGPVVDELKRVLRSLDLGESRSAAFSALQERTTAKQLKHFAGAILQAESMGVSLAPVLREQAQLLRRLQREEAREQAQKIPVKILFPVILCFVPALLLFVLGPVALSFF